MESGCDSDGTDDNEPKNEFLFESDHLALRSNKDYCKLLQYVLKLEVKKAKAIKDIETLSKLQLQAFDDPVDFVGKLQDGSIQLPERQNIPDLPKIDWNKYGIDLEDFDEIPDSQINSKEESNNVHFKVRGRIFNDNKPESFNQLWSCEEQQRLEELLIIYPEEEVEARRYKKIAKALGSRTPLQVMSRIQKYFNKLGKAGLPIPGRIPRHLQKAKSRQRSFVFKKSTFFPQLEVPVKMEDSIASCEDTESSSTLNNISALQVLKLAKEQRILDQQNPIIQTKSLCVGCNQTGYVGARWTDNAGTDYCTDCIVRILPKEKFTPIRDPP